jgi:hypothetical protein
MTITMRGGLTAALAATLLGAAACSSPEPAGSGADADLQRDLEAVQAVDAPRPARTQFVSPLELGRGPERPAPAPRAAARSAPVRRAAPPAARQVARRVAPAPRAVAAVEAAPAPELRPQAAEVAAAPEPSPTPEPVVAAPSRRPMPAPEPARRRGGWSSTADVIRNAPFPINP